MAEFQNISGFEFVKAGQFLFSENPYQFKGWTSRIFLDLFDARYEKADETAYIIKCETDIVYVGEFTYNLKDRWIRKGHVYHHMHDNIEQSLEKGKEVSIWLAISPYIQTPENGEMNISKAIEQHILRTHQPDWNSRNKHSAAKTWRKNNCIRLDSYITKP